MKFLEAGMNVNTLWLPLGGVNYLMIVEIIMSKTGGSRRAGKTMKMPPHVCLEVTAFDIANWPQARKPAREVKPCYGKFQSYSIACFTDDFSFVKNSGLQGYLLFVFQNMM